MEYRLDGFVAIVTGSGQGLGRAIALEMASQGATLVVTARRKTMIEEIAGGRFHYRAIGKGLRRYVRLERGVQISRTECFRSTQRKRPILRHMREIRLG